MSFPFDRLVFDPRDVDLSRSPLAGKIDAETYVLGAFNPGMTRLPNGNLLLMVRVAEALRTPIGDGHIRAIRWDEGGYTLDAWPLEFVDTSDPRKFMMRGAGWKVMALTSLSWLLPVELSADGRGVVSMVNFAERQPIAIREALEQQLGLKLEKAKLPIPTLVVERAKEPKEDQ